MSRSLQVPPRTPTPRTTSQPSTVTREMGQQDAAQASAGISLARAQRLGHRVGSYRVTPHTTVQRLEVSPRAQPEERETVDLLKIDDRHLLKALWVAMDERQNHLDVQNRRFHFANGDFEMVSRRLSTLDHLEQANRRGEAFRAHGTNAQAPGQFDIYVRTDNGDVIGTLPEIRKTAQQHMGAAIPKDERNSGWLSFFKYQSDQRDLNHPGHRAGNALVQAGVGHSLHFVFVPKTVAVGGLDDATAKTENRPGLYNTDGMQDLIGTYHEETGAFVRDPYSSRTINEYLLAGDLPPGAFSITMPSDGNFAALRNLNSPIRDLLMTEVPLFKNAMNQGRDGYMPKTVTRRLQAERFYKAYLARGPLAPDPALNPLRYDFGSDTDLERYLAGFTLAYAELLQEQAEQFVRDQRTSEVYVGMDEEEYDTEAYDLAERAPVDLTDPSDMIAANPTTVVEGNRLLNDYADKLAEDVRALGYRLPLYDAEARAFRS